MTGRIFESNNKKPSDNNLLMKYTTLGFFVPKITIKTPKILKN